MMWGYYPGWGGMFLMMVLSNILWIGLLGLLVWTVIRWFVRRASSQGSREPFPFGSSPSAQEILRQRYARGEIDTTTFEHMRERLDASASFEATQGTQKQPTMNTRS